MRFHPVLLSVCAAVSLGPGSARATATDAAAEAEARYRLIHARNVFHLKPASETREPEIQQPALPKLILTGITTILDTKRVLLVMQVPGAKPGEPGREISLILAEGQREGPIEILQIDEFNGCVRLNHSGTLMTLSFEKDGRALPAAAAPGPAVGVAQGMNAPSGGSRVQVFPGRPMQPPAPNAAPGAAALSQPAATGPAQPPLSAVEQAILIEAQRQVDSGNPNSNPSAQLLPPMPLK